MNTKRLEITTDFLPSQEIVCSDDLELNAVILGEIFDEKIYQPLLDHIEGIKNPTIVDIGSHIGLSVLYFSQRKDAKIHAIEPNPENYAMLTFNIKPHTNITSHMVAIGGINSRRVLKSFDSHHPETLYGQGKGIEVNAVTLKTFMEMNKISHIDALKIDCEGAEYEIFLLPDFREIAPRIPFIIGESHYQPSIPAMIPALLEPLGYTVEFLPFKNLTEGYSITLDDGSKYTVETKENTLFIATYGKQA